MTNTPISRKTINNIIITDKRPGNPDNIKTNFMPKSPSIVTKMCPAVKLAASLIPSATGLEILLTISIITRRGDIPNGDPEGKNILKVFNLKFLKAKITIQNHKLKANPKVIQIWVVTGNM